MLLPETLLIFIYKLKIVILKSFFFANVSFSFLVVLGGYGTMEELLEMITWAQLGIHKKPVTHQFLYLKI